MQVSYDPIDGGAEVNHLPGLEDGAEPLVVIQRLRDVKAERIVPARRLTPRHVLQRASEGTLEQRRRGATRFTLKRRQCGGDRPVAGGNRPLFKPRLHRRFQDLIKHMLDVIERQNVSVETMVLEPLQAVRYKTLHSRTERCLIRPNLRRGQGMQGNPMLFGDMANRTQLGGPDAFDDGIIAGELPLLNDSSFAALIPIGENGIASDLREACQHNPAHRFYDSKHTWVRRTAT